MEIEIKREKSRETVLPDPDTSFSYLERVRGSESEMAGRIIILKWRIFSARPLLRCEKIEAVKAS